MAFQKHCPGCFHDKSGVAVCPVCGYDESLPRPPLFLPHGIIIGGQYRVGRVLGQPGGFGITYLGWDVHLQQRVAIKEFLPRDIATRHPGQLDVSTHTEETRGNFEFGKEQFLREARIVAKLDHPNVVRVRTFFNANGTAYLVMDYYEGLSLGEYLSRVRKIIEPSLAVPLIRPVLEALQYLHEHGVVHRDLKPHNIYLATIGKPIVLDFGAARQAAGERQHSMSVVLTDGYAPLEQYQRRSSQGPWTDVYGAAATLYRMLTGVAPPTALDRLTDDPLERDGWAGIPEALHAALRRALALTPEARFQTAAEFIAALAEFRPLIAPPAAAASASVVPPSPAVDATRVAPTAAPTAATIPAPPTAPRAAPVSEARPSRRGAPLIPPDAVASPQPQPQPPAAARAAAPPVVEAAPTSAPSYRQQIEALMQAQDLPDADNPPTVTRRAFPMRPPTQPEAQESTRAPLRPASRLAPEAPEPAPEARPSWTVLAMPVALVAGLVLLVGVVVYHLLGRGVDASRPTMAATNTTSVPAVTAPPTAPTPVRPTALAPPPVLPQMRLLPAATARVGDDQGEAAERPAHGVRVAAFAISAEEISVEQFGAFVGQTRYDNPMWARYACASAGARSPSWSEPGFAQSPNRPVVCISAVDARAYAQWLSQASGLRFRLPTEAEWEYAARGGSSTRFWWGDRYQPTQASCAGCPQARSGPLPVGSWPRNAFGLADTAGNVGEWTCSAYAPYTDAGSESRCAGEYDRELSVRGGSWHENADALRPAHRQAMDANHRNVWTGFRIAQDP
ncbi:bifunctional serine/threonine-protein kinase/formylglycine-generating enzyme family protein [Hydrocarboniphaga sp.]|uniref:bifunctional serine/threonine-protein kinase/formylglycine-generating enzyme family protein n=1 Tax=Hydrocarboniphaga sp. TaxID=2033016 RepID=UPI003D0D125C